MSMSMSSRVGLVSPSASSWVTGEISSSNSAACAAPPRNEPKDSSTATGNITVTEK